MSFILRLPTRSCCNDSSNTICSNVCRNNSVPNTSNNRDSIPSWKSEQINEALLTGELIPPYNLSATNGPGLSAPSATNVTGLSAPSDINVLGLTAPSVINVAGLSAPSAINFSYNLSDINVPGLSAPSAIDVANYSMMNRTVKKKLAFGYNIQMESSLLETVRLQQACQLQSAQIFLRSKGYSIANIDSSDRQLAGEYLRERNSRLHVHCSLLTNLCSDREDVQMKSSTCLNITMNQIENFPGCCIVHIGSSSCKDISYNLNTIANHINNLYTRTPKSQLLMETSAGERNDMGHSWDHLRSLYEKLDRSVGLCLDTQHLFASGMSILQTHEDINTIFDQVESITGKQRCRVVHLNDSKIEYDGHVDKHKELFEGKIWYHQHNQCNGLAALLQRCVEYEIDVVLETPNNHDRELHYLRNLEL